MNRTKGILRALRLLIRIMLTCFIPVYVIIAAQLVDMELNFQPFYMILLSSIVGVLFGLGIVKIIKVDILNILLLLFCIGVLTFFLQQYFSNEGQTFYFGLIFTNEAGMLGILCYVIDSAYINVLSEISKYNRYGPLFGGLFAPFLFMILIIVNTDSLFINNMGMMLIFIISLGSLTAVSTDLCDLLLWEFSNEEEEKCEKSI